MDMVFLKDIANRWELSERVVQRYCSQGRIPGARKISRIWMLPADAVRPADPRLGRAGGALTLHPLPRRSALLIMTDLYHTPGSGEALIHTLEESNPEAAELFRAQLAYFRGQIEPAKSTAGTLLENAKGFETRLGCLFILALCAMYDGSLAQWQEALGHIEATVCASQNDRDQVAFVKAMLSGALYDQGGHPEWLKRGCFDSLPGDCFPAARFAYVKYLQLRSDMREDVDRAVLTEREALHLIALKKDAQAVLSTVEPLISQSHLEGALLSEIYLRLMAAITYQLYDMTHLAAAHLDRAIALALPDGLLGPFAEYRRQISSLMGERLKMADPSAFQRVTELNRRLMNGWVELHNRYMDHTVSKDLTDRELEAVRFAIRGAPNREIAGRLGVSSATVKALLESAMSKTGARNRRELSKFI